MPRAALSQAIEQKRFEPVYYFFGDEDYTKESALQRLISSALDPATRDFNWDQRRAATLDAASLGNLLGTPPVLAARRLIVLREAGGLKKEPRAVLEEYLKRPAGDVLVVLMSPAGEKADDAFLRLAGSVEFAPLDETSAVAWSIEHARSSHAANLTQAAAQLLVQVVGSDLTSLAAEIDKAVSYGGSEIETVAVEAVIGVRHGETVNDLLDAVIARRAVDSVRLVGPVLAQPKTGLVPVISALGSQLLGLGAAVALRRSGLSESAVRRVMWDLIKEIRPNVSGPWGEAIARWTAAASMWSVSDIQSGLRALLATDRAAKDSRVATDEQLLSTLVLELCGTRASAS